MKTTDTAATLSAKAARKAAILASTPTFALAIVTRAELEATNAAQAAAAALAAGDS